MVDNGLHIPGAFICGYNLAKCPIAPLILINGDWYHAISRQASIIGLLPRSFRVSPYLVTIKTLRPRHNGRHFPDDIFECIFLNANVLILIEISLKSVSIGPISNISALVHVMAWRRPGDKPLSEPMMVGLPKHMCVTRPQWVKRTSSSHSLVRSVEPGIIKRPKKIGICNNHAERKYPKNIHGYIDYLVTSNTHALMID